MEGGSCFWEIWKEDNGSPSIQRADNVKRIVEILSVRCRELYVCVGGGGYRISRGNLDAKGSRSHRFFNSPVIFTRLDTGRSSVWRMTHVELRSNNAHVK